jgi:preprotein translocase subunit SecA
MLSAIDKLWQEHLYGMDSLREAVYLRAYGQKDPLIEFKTEAYEMFTELMANMKNEILHNLFRSTSNIMAFEQFLSSLPHFLTAPELDGDHSAEPAPRPAPARASAPLPDSNGMGSLDEAFESRRVPEVAPLKVGRNDPCPCGSGKKFKNCCGKAG